MSNFNTEVFISQLLEPVSFKIDHTLLSKGLYLQSDVSGIVTVDMRLVHPQGYCKANGLKFQAINVEVVHALEHFLAVYLRKQLSTVLYVGPMGCLTGFYVIIDNRQERLSHQALMESLARYLSLALYDIHLHKEELPSNSVYECGNPIKPTLYKLAVVPVLDKLILDYIQVLGSLRTFDYPQQSF